VEKYYPADRLPGNSFLTKTPAFIARPSNIITEPKEFARKKDKRALLYNNFFRRQHKKSRGCKDKYIFFY